MVGIAALSGLSGTLISHKVYCFVSSGTLILFGCYYIWSYISGASWRVLRCCEDGGGEKTEANEKNESREFRTQDKETLKEVSKDVGEDKRVSNAGAISLITMTSLSPCVGSLPVLPSIIVSAGGISAMRILSAWMVLLLTAGGAMCVLVGVSFVGAKSVKLSGIRRHERLIMGIGLIMVGLLTLAMFSNHNHTHGHGVGGDHVDHDIHHRTSDGHAIQDTQGYSWTKSAVQDTDKNGQFEQGNGGSQTDGQGDGHGHGCHGH